jgi:hypothetical protein
VASRRIALVTAEGERFPITAWLPEKEELEPAADRVRAAAGLP